MLGNLLLYRRQVSVLPKKVRKTGIDGSEGRRERKREGGRKEEREGGRDHWRGGWRADQQAYFCGIGKEL